MKCPSCQASNRKAANFCSYCGLQLPIVVGASFPFGIRFPGHVDDSVSMLARGTSPKPEVSYIDGQRFITALFDRTTVRFLAELHRAAIVALPPGSILQTVDGGRSWFSGPSFWGCMSRRLDNAGVLDGEVEHWTARCHSYFGCLSAQKRQHVMYHREGWEVFYPGRHGTFAVPRPEADAGPLYEIARKDCNVFAVDRAKVKAEVVALVNRAGCHRCPLFSGAYLQQQVQKVPSVFHIGRDPDCGFLDCAIHGPGVWWRVY